MPFDPRVSQTARMPSPVLLISLPPCRSTSRWAALVMVVEQLLPPPVAGRRGSFGRPDDVGEQHRGQQPLGPPGNLELQGVDHDVADASREVDGVTVGCLVEVGGLPGGLASYRL